MISSKFTEVAPRLPVKLANLNMDHLWNSTAIIIAVILITVLYCSYALVFHPLAKFPGPKWAALTPTWIMRQTLTGKYIFTIKSLHDKYGPVVRLGPNELSFSSPDSWRDIYGHVPGRREFQKAPWYDPAPGEVPSIVTVRDFDDHATMRKSLSHAFSAGALSVQEDLIHHFVDMLIQQIDRNCTEKPGDMTKWLNYLTFDVIGQLAFGDPFGCVEAGKSHYWIDIIFATTTSMHILRALGYIPIIKSLMFKLYTTSLLPKSITEPRRKQLGYASEKITKRLNTHIARHDLLERMISEREKNGTTFQDLRSQAALLTIAGSETTSTALSGIMYHICRNPHVYDKLAQEVRQRFSGFSEITGTSTEPLPYIKAVIEEGLRTYPPVPVGLPRLSNGATVDGHYVPPGTLVYTTSWAATHSEKNFHKPYEFIPERWLDPECKDSKRASQPFSLGSRVCLGRNLAGLEMRLLLAKLIYVFDFKLMDDELDWIRDSRCLQFWKKPKLPIQFTRRAGIEIPPIAS